MRRRAVLRGSALCTTVALLVGCDYQGATSLPLPGTISGSDTYTVTAVFDDVAELVPKETCRSNNVVVGSVTSIKLGNELQARVTCSIKESVTLPANTVATISQTSLLGERFVALHPPDNESATGELPAGAVVPAADTRVTPSTEQVLGALSMILNGGSLGRIQHITTELNNALSGHEGDVRAVLDELTTLTGTLNKHSDDITRSLDTMQRLTDTLADQRQVLASALDAVPGGLRVLNDQKGRIINLLRHLSDLSEAAVPVINDSKANALAVLKKLRPILRNLAKNGEHIVDALKIASYPFPKNAPAAIKGDYTGLHATVNINMDMINRLLQQQTSSSGSGQGTPVEPPAPVDSAVPPRLPLPLPGTQGGSETPDNAPPLVGSLGQLLGGQP